MNLQHSIYIRQLGRQPYVPVWQAMKNYTQFRDAETPDEIWLVEHEPVFTQGQAGKAEHLLFPGNIPVVQVDRGGQVTYHGPGQQVAYLMINLKRKKLGVRELVSAIEQSIVALAAKSGIIAAPRKNAPGVYVGGAKLCSLGLRIRKGCSFHGLALNVNMDLEPFQRINPCGLAGIKIVQLSELGGAKSLQEVEQPLIKYLGQQLAYDSFLSDEQRLLLNCHHYPFTDLESLLEY